MQHAERTLKGDKVISHFFNARGTALERSVEGMLRSLIIHMIRDLPASEIAKLDVSGVEFDDFQWTTVKLENLLLSVVQRMKDVPVTCFIDALDECKESEIGAMIGFFDDLIEKSTNCGRKFRVCFASRHYPHVEVNNSSSKSLIVERHPGHAHDIQTFITGRLHIGNHENLDQIRDEILKKANGVFMWAVLAIEILNSKYRRGRIPGGEGPEGLERLLSDMPKDLHDLFRDILTRYVDVDNDHTSAETLLCMQWVIFAERPLRVTELRCAILLGIGETPVQCAEQNARLYILDVSRGLTETVSGADGGSDVVQVIHESVRDFLLKEKGLTRLMGHDDFDAMLDVGAYSHDVLKRICSNEIFGRAMNRYGQGRLWTTERILAMANDPKEGHPFLEYAVDSILHHADYAQDGYDQNEFLQMFEQNREWWIQVNRAYHQWRCPFQRKSSLTTILIRYSLVSLLKLHYAREEQAGRGHWFGLLPEATEWGNPIRPMMQSTQGRVGLSGVLDLHISRNASERMRDLLTTLKSKIPAGIADPNGRFRHFESILLQISNTAPELGLFFLVSILTAIDDTIATQLEAISEDGFTATIVFLLDHVALDAMGFTAPDLVKWAAVSRNTEASELLFRKFRQHINDRDIHGSTPLHFAAISGRAANIETLLRFKEIVCNARDTRGNTPLLAAIRHGTEALASVDALLASPLVDPDARNNKGVTPLLLAANFIRDPSGQMLQRILQVKDIDLRHCDHDGYTALHYAVSQCNVGCVALLLRTGGMYLAATNNHGQTALDYAVAKSQGDTFQEHKTDLATTIKLLKEYEGDQWCPSRRHPDYRHCPYPVTDYNQVECVYELEGNESTSVGNISVVKVKT